jgi:hypothetical protein
MKNSDIFNVNQIFESYEDSIGRAKQFLELSNQLFAQSKTEIDPAKKEALLQKSRHAHAVWMKLKDRAYGRASQDEKNAQAMQTMSGAARDYAKAKPGQYMGDDIENPGMAEGVWGDTAKLAGIPAVAGALAVGAGNYDAHQPHVEIGGQNAKIVQYGSSQIPDNAMTLKGSDGKMYKVWQTRGTGSGHVILASPAEPVKEAIGDEFSTQLARLIFKANPTLDSDEAILKAGYAIANKKDNYTGFFRDHDFLSDLVSAYHDLQQEDYYSLPMQHGDREDEGTDYKQMFEAKLNEFASCGGTGGVATTMSVGQGNKVGSLFGGSYSQKNSPFAKKQTKKRTGKMIKR